MIIIGGRSILVVLRLAVGLNASCRVQGTRLHSDADHELNTDQTPSKPKRRRFTFIMIIALVIVFGSALALLEYGNLSTINMNVTGSTHAYFEVVYGSTNVTLPEGQNALINVPPHANITIYAHPDQSYSVASWKVSGAQVIATGQDSVGIETGSDGSTITVTVNLSTSS